MRGLSPSLTTIEANLFDPSEALVQRYLDDDLSLPPEQREALATDAGVQRYQQALQEMQTSDQASEADQAPEVIAPVPLPPRLAELVQHRIDAQNLRLPTTPQPGLIVRIDQAMGPHGPLDWDMSRPFFALLSEPTEHRDIWYGWLMASEMDYAGHWDLLLEDSDQPYEPLAAMVQTWNPVHLYVPAISAALGQLSPDRLAAVRALANDLGGEQPDLSKAAPGTLVQRTTSAGHLVLTGSPLGDATDPRWRYQELYFEAAGFLRAMAQNALEQRAASQAQPWWETLLNAFKAAAQAADLSLMPVPVAALSDQAPSDNGRDVASEQAQRLGDLVEFRLLTSNEGDAVQIHLTRVQEEPLSVGIARGDQVRQQTLLNADHPEVDLFVGADQDWTFFIRDDNDQVLFFVELSRVRAPQ
ncbi:hypothetical protein CKO42_17275 [Lamprobacter modestohalophilus]|uniref:Uncharacterized protein n=1 Tax=Lamprobacter modestohalophilus TaxID=1064514 RepID=A0A9X1B5S3_9GAMM|nr:hypothetical protein [Lamprobacter modestohalophilus]MBK1620161.1 hypothetical protein [Lamprobacter modestohalophilus]